MQQFSTSQLQTKTHTHKQSQIKSGHNRNRIQVKKLNSQELLPTTTTKEFKLNYYIIY